MEVLEQIKKAYIEYVLEHNQKPASAYSLAKKIKIKEEEFYQHFNSVEMIESEIWLGFFKETRDIIEKEAEYAKYNVRQKVLAFYYTLLEVLKAQRSYVTYSYPNFSEQKRLLPSLPFLKDFKKEFRDFIDNLILEGRETQEIVERPAFILDRYPDIFWWQLLLILRFWIKDDSKGFEKSDAYIEKAVNFGFDLMGNTSLDSAFDFAKYAFQNR